MSSCFVSDDSDDRRFLNSRTRMFEPIRLGCLQLRFCKAQDKTLRFAVLSPLNEATIVDL